MPSKAEESTPDKRKPLLLPVIITALVTAVVIGGLSYLLRPTAPEPTVIYEPAIQEGVMVADEMKIEESEFDEILIRNNDSVYGYQGVAEFEGYYTTAERSTTLLPEPTKTCAAFKVTSGPEEALNYLSDRVAGIDDNIIVLGELNASFQSPWWNTPDIKTSTTSDPAKAIFRIGSLFESAAVGCFEPYISFIGTVPSN